MQRSNKIIAVFIIILFAVALLLLKIDDGNSFIKYNLICKGLKDARDFTIDEEGNYYIAYKDKVQYLQNDGKSFNIINNKKLNINSIIHKDGLYFTSNNSVFYYDMSNNILTEIINDLPNFGDYNASMLDSYGGSLYISIGSATNSGVVGKDNTWLNHMPYNYDITPFDITIKGHIFGEGRGETGAFVPYKTKNINGQIIPRHFPGNASIIKYNLSDGNVENFAWGIRNVKGMEFNSSGKLIASVGGMEDRGLRPVKGDMDYIYEIKKDVWYGWPDYSGGDPINSPKFKGKNNERIPFLLDKHPIVNPPAPLYQHKYLNSLGPITIDSLGAFGEKDDIYFYNMDDNTIERLNNKGVVEPVLKFSEKSNIKSIKIDKDRIIVLDNKQGYLFDYNIENKKH